jgi:hypothetical protein
MQRLRKTKIYITPPDEFRYTHAETGHVTKARTYNEWVSAAKAHRVGNNLSIPDNFVEQMEDQLCMLLPPEWCQFEDPNRRWVDTRFSIEDLSSGMRVFSTWMDEGRPFVEQAEAERRARICAGCPMNVQVHGCAPCHKLVHWISGNLFQRKTKHDGQLKACAVCRCANQAQIWFPLEILAEGDTEEKQLLYPSFCWKKRV